jgi:hypothetical protein
MLASMRASTDRKDQHKHVLCRRVEAQFTTLSAEIYEVQRMVLSSHTAIVDSTAK